MAQRKQIRLQIRSLTSLSGLRIWCCHELWCRSRHSLDLMWLWCRPAGCSSNLTPVWEPPCAMGAALKRQKKCEFPTVT